MYVALFLLFCFLFNTFGRDKHIPTSSFILSLLNIELAPSLIKVVPIFTDIIWKKELGIFNSS
uniref:Uncharacterized protein n=1 Tax=Solanum lycopersicum TaxID=4081 RepID=A0A3Q7H540_SOLLC